MISTLMSQYGSPEKREAFVYRTKKGYHVDLYRATIFIRTVECHDHSESYAERVAENWIQKVLN